MKLQIIPRQDTIPSFDPNALAVKHIEYYPFGDIYTDDEITPEVISKILAEIPEGTGVYFFLDSDGEADFLEVVSDGKWLSLGCSFEDPENGGFTCYYSYNDAFADTVDAISPANFSNENIYAPIVSGGQSPIPKIQTITDMELGVKAVEYFIHTGTCYPGMEWIKD